MRQKVVAVVFRLRVLHIDVKCGKETEVIGKKAFCAFVAQVDCVNFGMKHFVPLQIGTYQRGHNENRYTYPHLLLDLVNRFVMSTEI